MANGTESATAPTTYMRTVVLAVVLALAVIAVAAGFAEHQNRKIFEERVRTDVLTRVSVIRARLEGNINGNIQLVRGLVATMSMEPDMTQQRFSDLAGALLGEGSQLSHIAAAPDLVVTMVYPVDGNETAIGLDYRRNEAQRAAALRARDTGELVLAGPVDLVQGGRGFIGRFPVFSRTVGGRERFWGIVSAIIDIDRLYAASGLADPDLALDVAISGRDGKGGATSDLFFGDPKILEMDPVTVDVMLPSGSWRIAAVPKGGWAVDPPNTWMLRMLMAVGACLILVPVVLTGRLLAERQDHIAALRSRERDLLRLSRRLALALDTSRVGVWEALLADGSRLWDERTNEIYGFPADGGVRTYEHWMARVHPQDRERAVADFTRAVEEKRSYMCEFRILRGDGQIRHIRAMGRYSADPGEPERIIGVDWDITADVEHAEELLRANMLAEARNADLERAKARIEHNALHDSLTGLPNRRYLDEQMEQHAIEFGAGRENAALLHIDLDRFKQINDTLGHAAGDAMLVHVARVLGEAVEPGDFIARVGGDEFVVLLRRDASSGEPGADCLALLAEDILKRMRVPVMHEGHECRFGVSIGIASDTDSVADPTRLLVNADIALYRAKGNGRNRYQFFNDALQAEIVHTKRIADDILSGLDRGEFIAWYQPQFCAGTLDIIGVEALARWNHPTEGMLGPNAFMKIAEELNVVASIDRLILEQALRDMAEWKRQGLAIPKVSVNVSARRLHDEELIRGLGNLAIEPGTVSFELVESIFLDEQDELLTWNVDRIKELGIDIEIDDFGTGYASIVSLLKLKPSRLKIDRQLIMPVVSSAAQRQLVGSIIEIGKSLGIEVLAEGVETMEHARVLRGLGCQALQGYAFERAISADRLAAFVQSRRWLEAS